MIVSRSPLRISLGGGGTDLKSYYSKYGGYLIAATIDKYVYINIAKTFNKKFILKYAKMEEVNKLNQIKHPIFRETLKRFNIKTPLNISSHADIPAGTGMGSSGCFTVTLINAIACLKGKKISNREMAKIACDIEIETLKEPIGKQDQFTTSYPGINEFFFMKNGSVRVKKLNIKKNVIKKIKKNLVMYFTGYSRSSYKILQNQNKASKINDNEMLKNLHSVKELAKDFKDCLIKNNLDQYGLLMDEHWNLKKKRSRHMSNKRINYLYDYAKENGALGGKLIGAGGGGFLIFYTNNPTLLDARMELKGLYRTNFNIEYEGPKILAR
jgi:D-glycero-alpha-D-manno-heptose-7-phosphate kinase